MSKILSICLVLLILPAFAFAQPKTETTDSVNLAVMQGPTGFSSVNLDDFINVAVFSAPEEAVAKIVNEEFDMAVLPVSAAVNLYNKGVDIKFVATVGEGMLSVIGFDKDSKTIAVPGMGGTPDYMQKLLYPEYEASYSVTSPAQVAQLLIAGKTDLAILPQPFVNMVLTKNPECKILSDVQEQWAEKTGFKQYPMSVLVVREDFEDDNPKLVKRVKESYKQSIEWVIANPQQAGIKIEEKGIMTAALATGAVDKCALIFKEGREARKELIAYCTVVGDRIPDEDFWEK